MLVQLRAVVFAVWTLYHPSVTKLTTAPVIADAIAQSVLEDEPHSWSKEATAAVMALYAVKESWLRPDAVGDGGQSCGVWQTPCALTRRASVLTQARYWLHTVNEGGLAGVDSSPRRAQRRVSLALYLLAKATEERGLAEMQAP